MIVMSSAFLFGSILLFGRVAYAQTDSSQSKPYTFQWDDEFVPGAFDKELCGQDPESCEQKPEDMWDEAEQTEAESEEESTSTSASAGWSITKDSYSYTWYADNREVVSQAIFVDRYNQTTSIWTITVESNNTTRINTGIYSTGHTFFEKWWDVLGWAFFADLKQNTYILPKIWARVNVSDNVFALGKNINILNKNNVFVYNNEGGQFAPQNSDVFYINATEWLWINGASSKEGINVHGWVNVGEVDVTKSCVDHISKWLQYNAWVMWIAKQSPGCMVWCRSNNISLADSVKWYLIDQSDVCKQWCRRNAQYCKTDNPVEENRTSTPAQCTGFDIKENMKKCDSQDALLGNFKDITFIWYLTEVCPQNANEIANPCAYTCQDKYRVQSGACVYDPNRSCESWTVNYNCNGWDPVAWYTQRSTNKSLTLLTGGCSKESENKKLIGWSSSSSATEVEYGLWSGLTLWDKDCSKTLYAVYECAKWFILSGGVCVDGLRYGCWQDKYTCEGQWYTVEKTDTMESDKFEWICKWGEKRQRCSYECDDDETLVWSTLHNGACANQECAQCGDEVNTCKKGLPTEFIIKGTPGSNAKTATWRCESDSSIVACSKQWTVEKIGCPEDYIMKNWTCKLNAKYCGKIKAVGNDWSNINTANYKYTANWRCFGKPYTGHLEQADTTYWQLFPTHLHNKNNNGSRWSYRSNTDGVWLSEYINNQNKPSLCHDSPFNKTLIMNSQDDERFREYRCVLTNYGASDDGYTLTCTDSSTNAKPCWGETLWLDETQETLISWDSCDGWPVVCEEWKIYDNELKRCINLCSKWDNQRITNFTQVIWDQQDLCGSPYFHASNFGLVKYGRHRIYEWDCSYQNKTAHCRTFYECVDGYEHLSNGECVKECEPWYERWTDGLCYKFKCECPDWWWRPMPQDGRISCLWLSDRECMELDCQDDNLSDGMEYVCYHR